MQMTAPTLLLAQDDQRAESSVLRLLRERFHVLGIVADGAALVEWANQLRPDAVVVESDISGLNGLSAIATIHRRFPTIPIVVMTDDADPDFWRVAFRAGAAAFVFKAEAGEKLINVVRSLVAAGAAPTLLNEIGTLATVPTATSEIPKWVGTLAIEPSHEDIARRAYQRYEQRGNDHGHDQDDWFQAERELRRWLHDLADRMLFGSATLLRPTSTILSKV